MHLDALGLPWSVRNRACGSFSGPCLTDAGLLAYRAAILPSECTDRDSTIYSAKCDPLGGRTVAVKLYNKGKLSASKLRAIKREAAMMGYITRKGYATCCMQCRECATRLSYRRY